MRASIRAGAIIGAVASVALCLLQPHIALLVVGGIILAGALAGLAVAKWIGLAHYGRQLGEGARAGLLAAGLPGLCALVSLLVTGPHNVHALAVRSHVGAFGPPAALRPLASLGWAGLDVLFVAGASVAGIALAAVLAQTLAWSKSRHAARVIRQARLTALALQRGEQWDALPAAQPSVLSALTGSGIPVPAGAPRAGAGSSLFLAAAPASQPPRPTGAPLQWPAPPRPTGAPAPRTTLAPIAKAPRYDLELANATEPVVPVAAGDAKRVKRKTSRARPVDAQLNDDVRKALAAWAEQNPEVAETAKAGDRTPVASAYLNSEGPAPKRNRKKNATRDWIC